MPITFKKYLETRERKRFAEQDGLNDAISKLEDCKADRGQWDVQADFGAMVMANDLSFMDYLLGNKSDKNKLWGDNFVRTNISYSIANMQASDIKISVIGNKAERTEAQRLLQSEINFAVDRFNMLREDDQCLWFMKFMGLAYSYTGWNPLDQDSDWFTGKPFKTAIDSRKVWIDPNTEKKDKSDCEYFFHKEQYNTKSLKSKYPKIADLITENEQKEEYKKSTPFRTGKTDVIRHQYMLKIPLKRRAIVNETTKKTRYFLEEEYEYYLEEASKARGIEFEDIDQLKEMGEFRDETDVFPDNILASKQLDSEITAWFEILYIDGIQELLQPPIYVGNKSTYSVMAGNFDPNSAYSYGDAWREKDLLEASILMMTIQLFDTIRKYKPVPVLFPGAFLNEGDIRTKWGDPNLQIKLNPAFFEEHPNWKPRDCIWILDQPQVGQLQIALNDRINKIAENVEHTPAVSKGDSEFSGQSGKSVMALQQAAASGSNTVMTEYSEFMKNSYEILKVLIAENRNYKHDIYTVTENNTKGDVEVPENGLLDAAYDSYIDIVIEENSEVKKQIREQKFLQLFGMTDQFGNKLITKDDLIRVYIPDDAERIIKNNDAAEQQKLILDIVENNPMVQDIIAQVLQQTGAEGTMPPNSNIENQ